MIRTFRLQTLTGGAQPLFGDLLTAAVVAPPANGDVIVTVADTTLYQIGDRIILGFGQTTNNVLLVDSKVAGGTTKMRCKSEGDAKVNAYAIGTIIALAMAAMDIVVQVAAGSSNAVWLGTDNTVTNAGLGNAFAQVTASLPPWRMSQSADHNVVRTTDAWMAAVAGTQALVWANIL
jgi:hypothetical protein